MNAIIYSCPTNAKRIKFKVPYLAKEWRSRVKALNSSYYHYHQKLWSIVNTKDNLDALKTIFGNQYSIVQSASVSPLPTKKLSESSMEKLALLEQVIVLKGYSHHTRKSYRSSMIRFLSYFEDRDISQLTKEEIEGFIYHLVSKYKISETQQNLMINAIKFYYEKVLGLPRTYYQITRPKKSRSLPNVLSQDELFKLLSAVDNLKHKTILSTCYSGGLRVSELINLRVEDIHSDRSYLFVKGGKGKKDRKTLLSSVLLQLLREFSGQ